MATRTTEVMPDGSDRESRAGMAAEGLRSTFAPPDAEPHGMGGNRRGPQVTAEAVDKLFVHVAGGSRDQEGMGGTGGEPPLRPVKSPALPSQVRILSLPQPPHVQKRCHRGARQARPRGRVSLHIPSARRPADTARPSRAAGPNTRLAQPTGAWSAAAGECRRAGQAPPSAWRSCAAMMLAGPLSGAMAEASSSVTPERRELDPLEWCPAEWSRYRAGPLPDYGSGGRGFESLAARHQCAGQRPCGGSLSILRPPDCDQSATTLADTPSPAATTCDHGHSLRLHSC